MSYITSRLEPITGNIKAKLELFVCESGPRAVSLFRSVGFLRDLIEPKTSESVKESLKLFFVDSFCFFLSLFAPLYSIILVDFWG